MLNKVQLIGRVGKDPEIVEFQNGSIAKVTIATSEKWKDKVTGEKKEHTEWHNVVSGMPSVVNFAKNYLSKGDLVYVEGDLRTRSYEKNGSKVYVTEVKATRLHSLVKSGQPKPQAQTFDNSLPTDPNDLPY